MSSRNPLALLGVALLAIPAALLCSDLRTASAALLAVLVVLVPAAVLLLAPGERQLRVGPTARRAVPGLVAGASVALSSLVLQHDLGLAVTALLRILVLVLPSALVSAAIEPSALGDALAQRLRLPARPVLAAVVALQRVDGFGEDWEQLARARRSRGVSGSGPRGLSGVSARVRDVAALTFGLLVGAVRHGTETAVAMDARGFAAFGRGGHPRRTWARPSPWRLGDWALLLLGLLPTLAAVAAARL
ncbi:MAG: energy-coupling factor transporter transmembrane component T family protein [Actinomycetes bacterium]